MWERDAINLKNQWFLFLKIWSRVFSPLCRFARHPFPQVSSRLAFGLFIKSWWFFKKWTAFYHFKNENKSTHAHCRKFGGGRRGLKKRTKFTCKCYIHVIDTLAGTDCDTGSDMDESQKLTHWVTRGQTQRSRYLAIDWHEDQEGVKLSVVTEGGSGSAWGQSGWQASSAKEPRRTFLGPCEGSVLIGWLRWWLHGCLHSSDTYQPVLLKWVHCM